MQFNRVRTIGTQVLFGALVTASGIGMAMAELPAEATSATTTAKTDANTLGGIVLAILIGIAAYKWIRKAL
ncbi:major capsid protein [Pseudomonas benzopyrenica]|uniref:major capsid protein n=1 Tax=Pseudomonas benzopyrenica TaxID=2993566 RepID=UPI0022830F31|nr:major capsid protein [Pseudomonas benzopyrenica]MDC7832370.1 major capsid protein [Pseudomonas benzopyrenica]